MRSDRDMEPILDHWLADGPTEAPDRILDRLEARIEELPQQRVWGRGPLFGRRSRSPRLFVAAAAALILVVVAGLIVWRPPGPAAVGATQSPSSAAIGSTPSAPAAVVADITPCTSTPEKFYPKSFDLTGAWSGDNGGIIYVNQTGSDVWWNELSGQNAPPAAIGQVFDTVGHGVIKPDLTIEGEYADVPRGGYMFGGPVTYKVEADAAGNIQIRKTLDPKNNESWEDIVWTRCQPGFPGN